MKQTLLFCLLSISVSFGQCFDDDLRGSYGFHATTGAATASTQTGDAYFSTTPIGALVGSMSNINGGDAAGAFYFDGAGRIWGSSNVQMPQGVTRDAVGSYAVSSDCTVRVTVFDIYNDKVVATSPNNPTLVGVVLRGGDEAILSRLASITLGPNGRTAVKLVRFSDRYTAGCSVSTLRGSFGFIGDGVNKGAYAAVVARLTFDGDGKVVAGPAGGASQLAYLQYSGTYTVNADCSGTMILTQAGLPISITAKFLITPESGYVDAAGRLVSQPAQDLKPGLLFSIFDTDRAITGIGIAQ